MALAELTLLQPGWLLLWPAAPLLWWLLRRRLHWSAPEELFGSRLHWRHPALPRLTAAATPRRGPSWPALAAWSCLLLALAQPVRLGTPLPGPKAPLDLYVLLDTSISMVLADYQQGDATVSRLDFAKGLLDRLAADYRGERLGLYILGSPSARLLPASRDPALFRHTLARVTPALAGRRAELGDALARLADDLGEAEPDRERVVLLATDGTQPSGGLSPEAGAERLRRAGIPLYVLVTGARGDSDNQTAGGLLFAPARPGQLAGLAELTGGASYPAADIGALQSAMATLAARHLDGSEQAPRRREPLYPWALLLALLSALALRPARGTGP
jgi:Ca-activated chloride channel family protein